MDRFTITTPSPISKKLRKYAHKNDVSISAAAVKLIELGLIIDEKNSSNDDNEVAKENKSEELFKKFMILNGEILKAIAKENYQYNDDKMNEIMNKSMDTYSKIFN